MSDLATGQIFTDGQQNIAASDMNGIIGKATIQPDAIGTKPVSATMDVADQLLILKTNNTLARGRFDTITNSVSSQLPVADSTKNGMLKQLSGNATDFVGGDNACHPLSSLLPPRPRLLRSRHTAIRRPPGVNSDFASKRDIKGGSYYSSTNVRGLVTFPKRMAKNPTVTVYGNTSLINAVYLDASSGNSNVSSAVASETGIMLITLSAAAPASGSPAALAGWIADTGW